MKTMIWPKGFLALGIALLPAGLYADDDVYRLGRTAGADANAASVERLDIRSGDAAADTIDVRGGGGGGGGRGGGGGGFGGGGGRGGYGGGYRGGYGYGGYRGGYGYGYGRGWGYGGWGYGGWGWGGYGGYYGWPYYDYGYYSPYYYPSVYAYPYYYGAYSAYPYYGASVVTAQPTYYSNASGYSQAVTSIPVVTPTPVQTSYVQNGVTTVSAKPQQPETLSMPTPMNATQTLPMPKIDTPERPASSKGPIEKVVSLPKASPIPYFYAAYGNKPQGSDGKMLVVRK